MGLGFKDSGLGFWVEALGGDLQESKPKGFRTLRQNSSFGLRALQVLDAQEV